MKSYAGEMVIDDLPLLPTFTFADTANVSAVLVILYNLPESPHKMYKKLFVSS
jgi:hypothetical protein